MYYKVKVYIIKNTINKSIFLSPRYRDERRSYEYLDTIIIEKNKNDELEEIYTEFKIDLISKKNIDKKNLIDDKCINYRKLREQGIQVFAFEEDITQDNRATMDDIDVYFKQFFDSNYKTTIDNIELEKNKVKQKVRETKIEYLRLSRKKD